MKSLASITDKEIEIIKMALNDSISDMNTELKQELSPEKKNRLVDFQAKYTRVFDKLKQSGSIYAFANVSGLGMTGDEFTDFILDKANVALLPGSSFGQYADDFVRICYVNSIENIKLAIANIKTALKNRRD